MTQTPLLPAPLHARAAPLEVFGLVTDPPAGVARRRPILLGAPFGWEDSSSHRPLREWALHLAERGHPTLRIDLPGTGDSAGSPFSPDLFAAWSAGVAAAARRLAAHAGTAHVTVVGLGLSGLVAMDAATHEPAIGDIALWGVPSRGRQIVRQLQAFAKLERASGAVGPDGERVPIPAEIEEDDEAITAGGFLLTKETQDALRAVDLRKIELLPVEPARRVLLLARDGLPTDEAVHARLREQGVLVESADGVGFAQMSEHPQHAVAPTATIGLVDGWLAADPGDAGAAAAVDAPTDTEADDGVLLLDGVREEAITIAGAEARAFGVLAEPVSADRQDLTVVFLNAGAIRRTGPNRMWVEAARRWAARGIPSIRLDIGSIGDAPRPFRSYVEDSSLHGETMLVDVLAALDLAVDRGLPARFILVGLCSGSSMAFNVAQRDERVVAAVLLNPRSLVWSSQLVTTRDARVGARVVKGSQWKRLLRGEIERERIVAVSKAVVSYPLGAFERGKLRRGLRDAFRLLADRGVQLTLVFTGNEPLRDELARDGHLGEVPRWTNVAVFDVPGRDHTLRPRQEQVWVHDLMDRVVDETLQAPRTS
jgi:pimeloyl-ACP methyl ester carboxylesterase